MKLTDEQIAAIRDGCEGVTPGPWSQNSGIRTWIMAGKLNVATIPQANDGDWSPTNAAHIARCDPDTIRSITSELLKARALADHAERRHWHDGEPPKPQRDEWFIAETIYGDRVCLKSLPEEFTYDY